jgi:hypothetical protein
MKFIIEQVSIATTFFTKYLPPKILEVHVKVDNRLLKGVKAYLGVCDK